MDKYENPLTSRYASAEMSGLFGDLKKFSTWRKLWVALAEAQKELGLDITKGQLDEMRANVDKIDMARAAEIEKQTRHDVMAHIRTFGEAAPSAAPVIHLGATSAFVGDNTDCIILRDALGLVRKRILTVINALAEFAKKYKSLPCRGYTHFQSAQPTTVGKRACLWLQDLVSDLADLDYVMDTLRFRGAKGTTGTQASYLKLFDNDEKKVVELDRLVAEKMGFDEAHTWPVTGQTYPRKQDARVLALLSGIAAGSMKFAADMRLLAHRGELYEPMGKKQVGSSAMAYKRNPMRSERITSIGRYVITIALNGPLTAASQWMERTLDDSANRRIVLAEAFLAIDGILLIYGNIAGGIHVDKERVLRHVKLDTHLFASEDLLIEVVKAGGDRQEAHELIRKHSREINELGLPVEETNQRLNEVLAKEKMFKDVKNVITELDLNPAKHVGLAPAQVERFLAEHVNPVLEKETVERPSDLDV